MESIDAWEAKKIIDTKFKKIKKVKMRWINIRIHAWDHRNDREVFDRVNIAKDKKKIFLSDEKKTKCVDTLDFFVVIGSIIDEEIVVGVDEINRRMVSVRIGAGDDGLEKIFLPWWDGLFDRINWLITTINSYNSSESDVNESSHEISKKYFKFSINLTWRKTKLMKSRWNQSNTYSRWTVFFETMICIIFIIGLCWTIDLISRWFTLCPNMMLSSDSKKNEVSMYENWWEITSKLFR